MAWELKEKEKYDKIKIKLDKKKSDLLGKELCKAYGTSGADSGQCSGDSPGTCQ